MSTDQHWAVQLPLAPSLFQAAPRTLASTASFRVDAHRLTNGIEALAVSSAALDARVLPFTGQQVWDIVAHGRPLGMRSTFDGPVATTDYMSNNGAYLIHCGGSAMGNPGPDDEHPLHGELPNLRLTDAALCFVPATDGIPERLTVIGSATHRVAFGAWFSVRLSLTFSAGSAVMESDVRITNRSGEGRPLMYLAHLNFRPAVGGHLDEHFTGITTTRTAFQVGPADALTEHTGGDPVDITALLSAGIRVVPELVQTVPLATDADGWRTSRQVHANGDVDIVSHIADPLTHTIRWLRRSADDDAFGFALPATAEADGFLAEHAKGHVRNYSTGGALHARFRHGALRPNESMLPAQAGTPEGTP